MAASITNTYTVSVNINEPTTRQLVSIAPFDSSLGAFQSAEVAVAVYGMGFASWWCDPYGPCGEWVHDPDTGMDRWVPAYLHATWDVSLAASVFPPASPGRVVAIFNDHAGPFSASGGGDVQAADFSVDYFTSGMSTNAVFRHSGLTLALDLALPVGVSGDLPGSNRLVIDSRFDGTIVATVRYDYGPVPEPGASVMATGGLALLIIAAKSLKGITGAIG